ncbi:monovalent cation/H+ antiporter subunit D [Sphingobium jiangsuense]|uniref:Multicomponent K+:H+ antiporter subunit D n=1 Tax=Sphingobium jiangsuense TaxID=870476 RepID=A0A7W6FP00_9SPHN|nr:monovalent cation/H+ antiporter subunit D [Sphingobium jiangsuense]MBB3925601.1 multicomponent K+:H+ antiporter subunit D [Sphingobium jiangsuense]GLS99807.1 monovalent cation/H+ antiporter subunit D [Sphingobium jiangsuense]
MSPADHLVIAPILLPLLAAAFMLVLSERRRWLKRLISLATLSALAGVAIALLTMVDAPGGAPLAYRLGNWPAPFAITLVVDRLSALMLLLSASIGLCTLFYALARWDRAGPRFHPLFLLLTMGVNGAFLTGDLFNLFVFFEVMLAASYGLALHGSGVERTKASLHYVAINIATSLLFLIGIALIYAVTGTLNMADLAVRVPVLAGQELVLLESGAAILSIAFFVKAGMWPLGFWLTPTYAAAAAPVAATFAIMSKVGIYAIVRLSALAFGPASGLAAGFANEWLMAGGLATMAFGAIGMLAASRLSGIGGSYILLSSGTLLVATGTGSAPVLAGALLYLVSSTLGVCAMYLLIEPVERAADIDREAAQRQSEPVFEDDEPGLLMEEYEAEEEEDEIGIVIPATIALLGSAFIFCALLMAGLPPLSGFIAKFAIIDGMLSGLPAMGTGGWTAIAAILLSGLATLIAMTRAGISLLWVPVDRPQAHLRVVEAMPIALLLALCLALVIGAGPVTRYMKDTAAALHDPGRYAGAVLDPALQPPERRR